MNNSRSKRKLVCGVGTNDAGYHISQCPYYKRWHNMLIRCYDPKYHVTRPSYSDCTVCDEWLTFSVFRKWMATQKWEGKHLDKDILVPGNKIYSPEACVFITPALNNLLLDKEASKGKYPKGVSLRKRDLRFQAQISIDSKVTSLGYFDTVEEAEDTYKAAKAAEIIRQANMQTNRMVRDALLLIAQRLLGHSDPEHTLPYIEVRAERVRAAFAAAF